MIWLAWLLASLIIAVAWRLHRRSRRSALSAAETFARLFPGRCLVCSYHEHGVRHGFAADVEPPDHYCINRR